MAEAKVFQMDFAKVYGLLVGKAEKRAAPGPRWIP